MNKNPTVALAGNPNVGKSTVFNALTGLKQHTGNWAGKTVDLAEGRHTYKGVQYTLVDLPGTYSLATNSPEEEIARDYIRKGSDCVITVCDATCLERNLNLVIQIAEITPNVVLCLNLMDEAKKKSIHINIPKLEKELGIPVIAVTARSNRGLSRLIEAVTDIISGKIKPSPIKINYKRDDMDYITACRVLTAEGIACECISSREKSRDNKFDRFLTSKRFGIPVMAVFFGLIFWITIVGANYPTEILTAAFSAARRQLDLLFTSAPTWLTGILLDGVYNVLTWVVAVMLPPMAIFFPLFTLLEDLGYLPRIAFNLDRFFKKAHACGKQSLTMAMGFGCNACGVIGARIIDSPRERLIAVITNVFVPCNGRFPGIIAVISMFIVGGTGIFGSALSALALTAVIIFGVAATLAVSSLLSRTFLKGEPSSFTLELPPYRKPQIIKTLTRSLLDRTLFVLGRAVAVAAPTGAFIWLLANTVVGDSTLLAVFSDFLEPFGRLLGLDGVILLAFILGFPANEIVFPIAIMCYLAEGSIMELSSLQQLRELLVNNGWTWVTAVCVMIFTVCHFPCSTTCITVYKETKSLKWTAAAIAVPTFVGAVLCALFAGICNLFFAFLP